MLLDLVAILLERVECVLDGLVDGLLDGVADLGDLVDAPHVPGGVGDADGRHVEAGPVEPGPLAQLLDNLHHDPLPVALISHLAEKMPGALFSFFSNGFMVQAFFDHNCENSRRKKTQGVFGPKLNEPKEINKKIITISNPKDFI